MFDEEEPKKEKPIDLDDLSVEEIEKMIKGHQQEIEMLSLLLKKKKEKLKLAENFFQKKLVTFDQNEICVSTFFSDFFRFVVL
jgi:uncharacterized small protein (DUF1192 family)